MKIVCRYTINPKPTVLEMPLGAQVLHAASKGYEVCIWALVDPAQPLTRRTFVAYGTGEPLPSEDVEGQVDVERRHRYIGTARIEDHGELFFHVFEQTLITL